MLGKTLLAAAAAIAGFTALPSAAAAGHDPYYDRGGYYRGGYDRGGYYDRGYRGDYRRYRRGDYYRGGYAYRGGSGYRRGYARCGSGTTGAIVGGAAGALVGRDGRRGYYRRGRGGGGTVGAIVGGAVGALVGREIDRSC